LFSLLLEGEFGILLLQAWTALSQRHHGFLEGYRDGHPAPRLSLDPRVVCAHGEKKEKVERE